MFDIVRLENRVLPYPWGSRTVLAEMLGQPVPAPEPQAEMWMGAHPKAPSRLVSVPGTATAGTEGDTPIFLDRWIERFPSPILGDAVARRYAGKLPFLLKVLAAERALSIQAHPNRSQAARGFAREDAARIPLDDELRNYRDLNHKPEILYAVEPFTILRGFREIGEVVELCRAVALPAALERLGAAWSDPEQPEFLPRLFRGLLELDREGLRQILQRALQQIADGGLERDPTLRWLPRLAEQFPGDRGVLAPLYLNLVHLAPGQAIFTGPGILHAYLEGVGVELMANSDNVLRGGLTTKHVDVAELLEIVRCTPQASTLLEPSTTAEGLSYRGETPDFEMTVVEVDGSRRCTTHRGVEILFCGQGSATVRGAAGDLPCRRGDAFLVPAALPTFELVGEALFFRATAGP